MINFFLFSVLCLSWGSTWIAIKVGVGTVPPLFFAGTRFVVAGIIILGVTAIKSRSELVIPRVYYCKIVAAASLVVSISFSLIFWGEQFISASLTAIVVQSMIPIFLPLFSFFLDKEELSLYRVISIFLGIIGLGIIFYPNITVLSSSPDTNEKLTPVLGLATIVIGSLAYCYGSVLGRPLLLRSSAFAVAGWQSFIGGIFILICSFLVEMSTHSAVDFMNILLPRALFAWIWLVIIGSVIGFVLYIVLLKSWGAIKVSAYSLATPVIALMLDYLWFGKVIFPSEMVGMAVIFIAFLFAF